jgi:hypothetical protein
MYFSQDSQRENTSNMRKQPLIYPFAQQVEKKSNTFEVCSKSMKQKNDPVRLGPM